MEAVSRARICYCAVWRLYITLNVLLQKIHSPLNSWFQFLPVVRQDLWCDAIIAEQGGST